MDDLAPMDIADIQYFAERFLRLRGIEVADGGQESSLDGADGTRYDLSDAFRLCRWPPTTGMAASGAGAPGSAVPADSQTRHRGC